MNENETLGELRDAHNKFDHSLKDLVAPAIFRICALPRGEFIKLNTERRRTQEKRVDILIRVKAANSSDDYAAHVEIQSEDDSKMLLRMLDYWMMIYEDLEIDVHQYVVYASDRPTQMISELQKKRLNFSFQLIDLKTVDGEPFLASLIPEEVIMAILCKYPEGSNPPEVIVRILKKLEILDLGEPSRLKKHLIHLQIISQLRNLQQETVHQIKSTMPQSFYDIKKDPIYIEVKEEGREVGKEEGREETTRAAIERMLIKNLLSEIGIAEAQDVPLSLVVYIKEELIQSGILKASM